MKKLILIFVIFTFGICLSHAEVKPNEFHKDQAQYRLGSKENPMKIGLMLVEPFVVKEGDVYQGLVIDYWKHISKGQDWHYVFIDLPPNYSKAIEDTANGKYDLALGNFSTTAERMSSVHFSRPFMLNRITILTKADIVNPLTVVMGVIYSISEILLIVFLLIGIVTVLLWFFKAKGDGATFKSFFYISCVNLLGTVIETRFKKFTIVMLLLVGLIVKAIFIGSITSTLFNLSLARKDPFVSTQDISGKIFIVVKGSSFAEKMRALNARIYEYNGSNEEAAEFYARNTAKYDGYVSDFALIFKYANQFSDIEPNLIVSDFNVRNDNLAFVLNKSFPFRTIFDQKILELQDTNLGYTICSIYVGDEARNCVM